MSHNALARAAAVALLAGAATLGVAAPAFAHDTLVASAVVADDGARASAVRLTFSDSIIEVGTEIIITDADGGDATNGAAEVSGPDVTQPLADDLEPGRYSGAWRVVSSDGHPIEGRFSLVIAADGGGTIQDEAIQEDTSQGDADEETSAAASQDGDGGSAAGKGAAIGGAIGAAAVVGAVVFIIGSQRRSRAANARDEEQKR